jgi:hypothetical protein
MNEHTIEVLEELFPDGCIVIYRNMKRDHETTDCFGVYVANPKQSESLDDFSSFVIDALDNEQEEEEEGEDNEEDG